jgi:hypothetical protein
VDDHHSNESPHKVVAVVENPDGGIEPYLGEGVGQEKGEHKETPAREFEAGYGVARGDAEYHGHGGGNDSKDKGQGDGRNEVFLGEDKFPPSEAEFLGNDPRDLIDIAEGQDNQVQDGAIKEEQEKGENDKFPKFLPAKRGIQALGIKVSKHTKKTPVFYEILPAVF